MSSSNKTKSKSPVFIVGAERSGTTLMRVIMAAHSKISIAPEALIFDFLYDKYNKGSDVNSENIQVVLEDLVNVDKFKDWGISKAELEKEVEELDEINFKNIIQIPYIIYARNQGKVIWGDKNPLHSLKIEEIISVFPDARFIHIIRDGRDTVLSLRETEWGTKDVNEAATDWVNFVSSANTSAKVHSNNVVEINYENLVSNPEEVIKNVTDFLGIEFEKSMLEFYKENAKKKLIPSWQRSFHQNTYRAITKSRSGRGIATLSPSDLFKVQTIEVDVLVDNGYDLVSLPSKQPINQDELYHFYKSIQKKEINSLEIGHVNHRDNDQNNSILKKIFNKLFK